jgi:hypothetical protein
MDEEDPPRPRRGLLLAPEYGADMPVWLLSDDEHYGGDLDAEALMEIGVPWTLIERLRAWQSNWDHDPESSSAPPQFAVGSPLSVRLARDLQWELSEFCIYLGSEAGPRRVDEWVD